MLFDAHVMSLAKVLLPLSQFAFKMSDNAYMSMLNNPSINPPTGQNNVQLERVSPSKFTEPIGTKAAAAKQRLEQVTQNLVYISESDEPFTFFNIPWKESSFPSLDQFITLVNEDVEAESHDEEWSTRTSTSIDQFFEPLTSGDDPYNQAAEYIQLQDTFVELFGHRVQVYSFGSSEIKVYITGNCEDGLVGVKTTKVET